MKTYCMKEANSHMFRSLLSKGLSWTCSTSTKLVSRSASRRLRFRPGMLKGAARNARVGGGKDVSRGKKVLTKESAVAECGDPGIEFEQRMCRGGEMFQGACSPDS